jgi:FtsZ-binding cell division protein ZapB
MRLMQRELEDMKEARQREARQAQEDREELIIFRDRCNKLEEENEVRQGRVILLLRLRLFNV